ncbi:lipid transfer-like protein VAS [Phalaenopsis equestris]|uniref:lipid transfer-like protein VAS n=1 Tax=Phalaenopsis equestris TaxID=78828 RepID=UPI0009E60A04|nr:lipid transfer-like protein VAS [Phalaenopsis equestris]
MAMKLNASTALLFIFFLAMQQIQHSAEGSTSVLPCLERILPCQYYMHSSNPPSSCCTHLKDMMNFNPRCFCTVFRNDNILTAMKASTLDAAKLSANCGLKPNFELCDETSRSSITVGQNFIKANVIILGTISLLIVIGIM